MRAIAKQLFAAGKIKAWNSRGDRDVRVLINTDWVKLTKPLAAQLEG